jgi:DNA-binding NarL/FixJ family response regulator
VTVTVLLVDDQPLVRSGLRMILETSTQFTVVGEAANGLEALSAVDATRPDVVIMDVQMPVLDGIEATRRIAAHPPAPRVLILTTFEQDDYLHDALRAGASGFLLKNSPPERLLDAVAIVAAGDSLVDPAMTRRLLDTFSARAPVRPSNLLPTLTDRETDVLRAVARGLSNAEIAELLIIGESTVKTHVSSVLVKLALRDRVQAVVFAYEHGVITPGTNA